VGRPATPIRRGLIGVITVKSEEIKSSLAKVLAASKKAQRLTDSEIIPTQNHPSASKNPLRHGRILAQCLVAYTPTPPALRTVFPQRLHICEGNHGPSHPQR
jgi:predicted metal-dependent phosphotriesterase family hydrolase